MVHIFRMSPFHAQLWIILFLSPASLSYVELNPGGQPKVNQFLVGPGSILLPGERVWLYCSSSHGARSYVDFQESYSDLGAGGNCNSGQNIRQDLNTYWSYNMVESDIMEDFQSNNFTATSFSQAIAKFYCCGDGGWNALSILQEVTHASGPGFVMAAEPNENFLLACKVDVMPARLDRAALNEFKWSFSRTLPQNKEDLKNGQVASENGRDISYINEVGNNVLQLKIDRFDVGRDGGIFTCYHERTAFVNGGPQSYTSIYAYSKAVVNLHSQDYNTVVSDIADPVDRRKAVRTLRGSSVKLTCTASGYPVATKDNMYFEIEDDSTGERRWKDASLIDRIEVYQLGEDNPQVDLLVNNVTDAEAKDWTLRCRVNQKLVANSGLSGLSDQDEWATALEFHFIVTEDTPTTPRPTQSVGGGGVIDNGAGSGSGTGSGNTGGPPGTDSSTATIAIIVSVAVLLLIVVAIFVCRLRSGRKKQEELRFERDQVAMCPPPAGREAEMPTNGKFNPISHNISRLNSPAPSHFGRVASPAPSKLDGETASVAYSSYPDQRSLHSRQAFTPVPFTPVPVSVLDRSTPATFNGYSDQESSHGRLLSNVPSDYTGEQPIEYYPQPTQRSNRGAHTPLPPPPVPMDRGQTPASFNGNPALFDGNPVSFDENQEMPQDTQSGRASSNVFGSRHKFASDW